MIHRCAAFAAAVVASACLVQAAGASGRLDGRLDALEACIGQSQADRDAVLSALGAPGRLELLRHDALEHAESPLRRIVGAPETASVRDFMAEDASAPSSAEAFVLLLALHVGARDAETPDRRRRLRALFLYHLSSAVPDRCPQDNEFLSLIGKER